MVALIPMMMFLLLTGSNLYMMPSLAGADGNVSINQSYLLEVTVPKVVISVYYEALCPDSMDFFKDQLNLLLDTDVAPYVSIDLVPFGKASWVDNPDGSITFRCQHGSRECLGNTIMACALKHYPSDASLKLTSCMMGTQNPTSAGATCAAQLGYDYTAVSTCSEQTSFEGQKLLKMAGILTKALQPKMVFVPWINFDGTHDRTSQAQALRDLMGVVCDRLKGKVSSPDVLPKSCQQ